jgi:hypothetical protein
MRDGWPLSLSKTCYVVGEQGGVTRQTKPHQVQHNTTSLCYLCFSAVGWSETPFLFLPDAKSHSQISEYWWCQPIRNKSSPCTIFISNYHNWNKIRTLKQCQLQWRNDIIKLLIWISSYLSNYDPQTTFRRWNRARTEPEMLWYSA